MGPLTQCPRRALPVHIHCCTNPQLEVAMLRKRRKVPSRAMNVPIVVHAMERVDCAPATRDTLENRVRPKPSWSKGRHHYSLDCEIHNVVLAAYVATPKNIITCRIGKLVKFVDCLLYTRKYHQKAFVLFTVLYMHKYHQKAFVLF